MEAWISTFHSVISFRRVVSVVLRDLYEEDAPDETVEPVGSRRDDVRCFGVRLVCAEQAARPPASRDHV